MIIDSSALVAILFEEPDAPRLAGVIESHQTRRISAATFLEVAIVVDKRTWPARDRRLDEIVSESSITVEPVTEVQAKIARDAYRDYGKGSGHPAGLNFGDCFSYALARDKGEPLLFKGDDFTKTDVTSALA